MEIKLLLFISALSSSLFIHQVKSAKILFFFDPDNYYQERELFQSLAQKLGAKGHNITVLPQYLHSDSNPNITVLFPNYFFHENKKTFENLVEETIAAKFQDKYHDPLLIGNSLWDTFMSSQENLLKCSEFKQWAHSAQYDLIIFSNNGQEIAAALAFKMKAKTIIFASSGENLMYNSDMFGLPIESSWLPDWTRGSKYFFIPDHFLYAYNTISWYLSYKWSYLPRVDSLIRQIYPNDTIPSSEELLRNNVSLILLNEHQSNGYPRALPPFVIQVGGIHTKESERALSKELEAIIAAKDHFVFIALKNINFSGSKQCQEILEILIKVMGSMKNTNFLWKWGGGHAPKKLPPNIHLNNYWSPQTNNILGHPRCKGLITEGNKIVIDEATYHGVPILTLPVLPQELYTSRSLEFHGIAKLLELAETTEETFKESLLEILNNPTYSEKAKIISERFKERPLSALDKAVWWIEYALKHDTSHLKSPGIHQYWWQRRLMDFYLALLLAGIILIFLRFYFGRLILRFLVKCFYKTKEKLKRS